MSDVETEETYVAPIDAPEEEQDGDGDDEAAEAAQTLSPAPPPESLSERDVKRLERQLELEAKRHRGRVAELIGDAAQFLLVCPWCQPEMAGFYFPDDVDDELRARVYGAFGEAIPTEYAPDPEAAMCDVCNGLGELRTHSRVPGFETRPCAKCGAKGWTSSDERRAWDAQQAARTAAAEVSVPAPPAGATMEDLPWSDPWGRPRGAPNYGRDPQYMTAVERSTDWPGVGANA